MVEIPGFSDLLSQLGPFPGLGGLITGGAETEEPEAGTVSMPTDSVVFHRLPSNSQGTSDLAADAPPKAVAVAQDGTYRPTLQTSAQFAMAFDFEFNMSVRRQVTLVQHPPAQHSGDRAAVRAREVTSLFYRSSSTSYKGSIGSSFMEARSFQTEMFFSRTRQLSVRLDQGLAQQHESTSHRVARTFELDISLNASFLSHFIHQSEEIEALDRDLLGQYLQTTDNTAEATGQAMQSFFDGVGSILEETQDYLMETLDGFFRQAAETFGLTDTETEALQALASDQIVTFFDDVDRLLADTRTMLAEFGLGRGLPKPEMEPAPEVEAGAGVPESDGMEAAAPA